MLDWLARRLEVSPTVVAALLVVVLVQVGMQLYALVDLTRRRAVRGPKWVWALVVAFGSLPGAIAYLAAGRSPSEADVLSASSEKAAGKESARRAVDTLYGPPDPR